MKKQLIFIVFLFITGICFLVEGIKVEYRDYNALDLAELTKDEIKQGKYVKGYIDTYVSKKIFNLADGGYSGVSSTYLDGSDECDVYTLMLPDESYVQFMTADKETKEKLNLLLPNKQTDTKINTNKEAEKIDKVYVEGKIIVSPVGVNKKWFEDVDREKYPNIDSIMKDDAIMYTLKQTDIDNRKNCIYVGFSFLFAAFVFFILLESSSNFPIR